MSHSAPVVLLIAEGADRAALAEAVREGGAVPTTLEAGAERIGMAVWSARSAVPLEQVVAQLSPSAHMVAVQDDRDLKSALAHFATAPCHHVVTHSDEGRRAVARIVDKWRSGELFGIERHVPESSAVHVLRISDYAGRTRALDEVAHAAERAGVRSALRAQVVQACEELLMNGLYHAPISDDGEPLFEDLDSKTRLQVVSPRPVSLRFADDGQRFVLAVRDRYGRLEKPTLARYLEKCMAQGNAQIDRKASGAGLGLFLIASTASELVINVAPEMATEVICTFDHHRASSGPRGPEVLSFFVHPGAHAEAT